MALGPGKYDELCTLARERAKALAAVVIIIDGEHGSGFSVQGPAALTLDLPCILRLLADDIEKDNPP